MAKRRASGVALISKERRRQVSKEGWTLAHDDTHSDAEMVGAAINYADLARFIAAYDRTDGEHFFRGMPSKMECWPRDWVWKPDYSDPIHNLVRAGALIAAEIDRLLRLGKPMTRKRKPPTKRAGPAFEPCGNCCSGWTVRITAYGGPDAAKMVRCPCWLAHQSRLADLERQEQT